MQETLRALKGVGDKTQVLLEKLGLVTVQDFLRYYPRSYISYDEPRPIPELCEGKTGTVFARVSSPVLLNAGRGRKTASTILADSQGKISAVWFNAPFVKGALKTGGWYIFRGKVNRRRGQAVFEHPEFFEEDAYRKIAGRLMPVYGLTAGLSNKTMTRIAAQALEAAGPQEEYLPEKILKDLELMPLDQALRGIHFPKDRGHLETARRRLAFDEFFLFILCVRQLRSQTKKAVSSWPMKAGWKVQDVIHSLPYRLTDAQNAAWQETERDLCSGALMSRLIQGDVGCGKTILAFLAMIHTVENGCQAALMAPTEVLARQHYDDLTELCSRNSLSDCRPVLLTGSVKGTARKAALEGIRDGSYNMIIGTHALIQENVDFRALALAVIDEQHRFGVRQREALAGRRGAPHVLVMSATPIPRTLALILYGDLDISVIDEMPSDRIPIKNCAVDTGWRDKAYAFMERQIRQGRQAFVICPMVEPNEDIEAENVTEYSAKLKKIFPEDITVGVLHGRMKPQEKDAVMEAFASGNIKILVSTTVIEVGIHVPNASVMVIENAERFGLAQLHQLRGRVGRGKWQSYCIFIQGVQDEEASQRLNTISRSNDGFFISGEDLRLRGPGDLFGVRQSGDLVFRLGDIYHDADLLQKASQAAGELLEEDPLLSDEQHQKLRTVLDEYRSSSSDRLPL